VVFGYEHRDQTYACHAISGQALLCREESDAEVTGLSHCVSVRSAAGGMILVHTRFNHLSRHRKPLAKSDTQLQKNWFG